MAKVLNKKGDVSLAQRRTTTLIVLIVGFVVLAVFVAMVVALLSKESDYALCKTSAGIKWGMQQTKVGVSEVDIQLLCYTQYVTVKEDGIFVKGRDKKERELDISKKEWPSYSGAGSKSRMDITNERIDLVKRAVADQMYNCWDQFYEGKLPIFLSGARCVTCAEIKFDHRWLGGDIVAEIEDFGGFLKTQNTTDNPKITYEQFIKNKFEAKLSIDTRVRTKIVFTAAARSWLQNLGDTTFLGCYAGYNIGAVLGIAGGPVGVVGGAVVGTLKGCLVGGVIGLATAKSDYVPFLVIGPAGAVTTSCERMW